MCIRDSPPSLPRLTFVLFSAEARLRRQTRRGSWRLHRFGPAERNQTQPNQILAVTSTRIAVSCVGFRGVCEARC
eukprot:145700-Rhodomonas_salina.2